MNEELELNIIKARERLFKAQERFKCFPDLNIVINDLFSFNMNSSFAWHCNPRSIIQDPYLKCYMADEMLTGLLQRRMHWNNLELGCHIMFDRRPNIYIPDVHILMSFFHT